MNQEEIADRLELGQLMLRYVEAIDAKDWVALDGVFTPDAHLDYESSGGPDGKGDYPTIRAWLETNLAMFPMTQHLIGQSLITVDGDTAQCRTMFNNPMGVPVNADGIYDAAGEGMHIFTVGGVYEDTCVRTEDGWKISKKVEHHLFTDGSFPPFS